MGISSVGGASTLAIQNLISERNQLNTLQQQLSTGQKSQTYAGLGTDSGLTVSLNAQIANLGSYDNTISNVSTRVSLVQTVLGRVSDIGNSTKSSLTQANFASNTAGSVSAQATAVSSLDELLSLLNTQAGNRSLFSGKATTTPAVDTSDHIINGNGGQAGLKQLISERNQADLGADGLGRLSVTAPGATSVGLTEDAGPFGLKIASVNSTLTGATVTGPAGSPAALSVNLGATNPAAGDQFTVRFNLPDGTSENVTLTATTDSPPGQNQFTIGATSTDTAANLKTALTGAVSTLAGSSLAAASTVVASNDFFNADINNPPTRVDGPPFDTATGTVAGTAANTVIWYTGDPSDPSAARSSSTARIDPSLTVNYGVQANEAGIRSVLQNVATLAAVTYSSSDPNAQLKSAALNQRLSNNLNAPDGVQAVTTIEAQLAGTQVSLQSATNRHAQVSATLGNYLSQITGVSDEEVGAQILSVQTRLQASLQTTALLFQTNLVNYLK